MKSLSKKLVTAGSIGALAMAAAMTLSTGALAQEDGYWAGKTVTVNIRSTAGGGYDSHGRLVARHLGKHLPGNPDVRAVNRPGAGGVVAANYIANQAPNDGTEILIAAREIALAQRIGTQGVRYDVREIPVLGSPVSDNRIWAGAPDSPVTNLEELENYDGTFLFAVSGPGAGSAQMVDLLKAAGYPVDIVTGYEGTGDQILSILRGETQGWNGTYPGNKSVVVDEDLTIIAKLGNHPELAQYDDVRDHLQGDMRSLASVLAAPLVAGRPFVTVPNTPDDVLAQLRQAFEDTMNDPAYIRELNQMGEELSFSGPEEIEELFMETLDAPDAAIEAFREAE